MTHQLFFTTLLCLALAGCSVDELRVHDATRLSTSDQITDIDPTLGNVPLGDLQTLAASAYANADYTRSEKAYKALLLRTPTDPLVWLRLGNIYAHTSRPDAAVAAYREALVRNPSEARAWHNMGVLQLKQAANSFQQMLVHVPDNDPLVATAKQTRNSILIVLKGGDLSGGQTAGAPAPEPEVVSSDSAKSAPRAP